MTVDIQPEVIRWALNQSEEERLGERLLKDINRRLAGEGSLTFNQIEEFSRRSGIPLGYFFFQTPPEENLLESVVSGEPAVCGREMINTITDMESVRDWMADYRREEGLEPNPYVGSVAATDKYAVSSAIRADIGISEDRYEKPKTAREGFAAIRRLLERCGVLVMMNTVAGKNREFRAFAIADDYAPLIFINATNSWNGRLFSLFRETARLWIGENDLFNDRKETNRVRPMEVLCGAAARELLVPDAVFLKKWETSRKTDVREKIKEITADFLCDESVIAGAALDNGKINRALFREILKSEEESPSGGDDLEEWEKTDSVFARCLCVRVNEGKTSYTEAYRLTGTTGKTFPEVMKKLGGELW